MASIIGCLLIGVFIGIVLMIIISVMVISGRESDEEYRRNMEEYEGTIDGSEGLSEDNK